MGNLKSSDFVLSLLAKKVDAAGGFRPFAKSHGVASGYVYNCLRGDCPIGPSVATALGFEPVTMYAPIKTTKKGKAK